MIYSDIYNNYQDKIKFFYEDAKNLKKLENNLFKIIKNILDYISSDNNKHEKLIKNTFGSVPSFSMYVKDIPDEINTKLDQLPEPVLHDFTNNLIDRLNKCMIQNVKLHRYQYFVEEIRDNWLLSGDLFRMSYLDYHTYLYNNCNNQLLVLDINTKEEK